VQYLFSHNVILCLLNILHYSTVERRGAVQNNILFSSLTGITGITVLGSKIQSERERDTEREKERERNRDNDLRLAIEDSWQETR
jgi:hypothetical protein